MPRPADARTSPSRTLSIAGAGTVLAMIAYTVPLSTLPGTAATLGTGPSGQSWILSAMSLGFAVGLLPAGALGDDHGRRRMFVLGALVLAVTSAAAAVAPATFPLVAARVGHGLGAAAVIACSLGLIGQAFPPGPRRLRATGIWGACLGLGIALGPLLAAGLEVVWSWRGAYVAVAVLAGVLALVARRGLEESTADVRRRADGAGMLLLGAALAALLTGLVLIRTGPGVVAAGLLAGGALLGVGFAVVELRHARDGRDPMLDLRLFRRPDFAAATVAALATGGGVTAAMSFLPTLVQRGLGYSVVVAALVVLVWSGTSVLAALLTRRLPARVPPRAQLVGGLLGVAAGLVLLTGISTQSGPGRLLPGLIVAGIASGVLNATLARQAVASMPAGLASLGSGANNTARYLGAAVGVTVVAVLAAHPDAAEVVAGWNTAVLGTAGLSVVGAFAVVVFRSRRQEGAELEGRSVR